jgi:uncharacterized protein YjbI with pentapeptide repeats
MKQCALLDYQLGLPRCQRPALADPQAQGFCILHAPWDGKDLSAFQAAIDEIIEKARQGSGVCNFSHCYFPSNYDCRNLKKAFEFNCYFYEAKFSGNAVFEKADFWNADFSNAKFYGEAIFKRANFGGANFVEVEFSREANFSGAKFSWYADFTEAKFARDADFQGTEFYINANFSEVKFSGEAKFLEAKFYKDADFRVADFSKGANFLKAKFSQVANFVRAKFFGVIGFLSAEFSGEANFQGAEFSEGASFLEAKFSRGAYFLETTFSGDANFGGAKFYGNAYFGGAKFFGKIDFNTAEFRQRADFSEVQTAKDATVYFREVSLLKPQQVFFHHVDLSRWSFLDTDLRRIDFDNVAWGTIPSISPLRSRRWIQRWERRHLSRRFLLRLLRLRLRLTPTRTAIFDEIRVSKEKVKKARLAKVERLYRHLKQNYESQRDYGRAGDFYYGEMEMKRRQLNPLGQIPFWIYRILSGYGESYPRALFWLIVMWLLFAVLFTVVGYTDEWGNHADLWRSLIYSAQSMTPFHEPNITFHSAWGKAIKLVASVLGVIQIALFGLALQRRFKR